jgi:hypothetical protein
MDFRDSELSRDEVREQLAALGFKNVPDVRNMITFQAYSFIRTF